MVAHLIRLRFLLLGNMLRRSPWQIVATVLGGLYGLGVLALVVAGLVALGFAPLELARTITVLGGALVVAGWVVLPLIASGTDQTVDPARLARFPIRPTTLVVALTASGVLGVPGIVTSIAALASALTWARHPLAAVVAVPSVALGVLVCVIGSRLAVALASGHLGGRRAQERRGLLVLIPLILLGPIIVGLSSLVRSAPAVWPSVAAVASWTPLGAAWAVPGDVAAGSVGIAALHALITVATVVLAALAWRRALARALETPARESSSGVSHAGLGLFGLFPGTPTGAVAARALTYWVRDPRYSRSLVIIPLVPVLLAFYSTTTRNPGMLVATGPLVALLLGLSIYTDVSYDNTAFALHLQKGASGRADRIGRVVALAVFAVPVTILLAIGSIWYLGSWSALPGVLGLSLGALASAFGLSSVTSARWAFPVPAPGDNPFRARPGGGFSLVLTTWGTWGALAVLASPELVLAAVGAATGSALLEWLALAVGLLLGCALLVVGVRWGGAILDRRGPELLAQLQEQK